MGEEKMLSAQGIGANPTRRQTVPEFRVEALEGGFLVWTHDGTYNGGMGPDRLIVPNADCLMSFVQKWANEASKGR